MKRIIKLVLAALLFNSIVCQAGINSFIITVKSDNPGVSGNKEFTIPTTGSGYNYNVDCNNDGSFEAIGVLGDYTCDFSVLGGAGTYQLRIEGADLDFEGFPQIYFNNGGDKLKITNIDQWGTNPWKSMQGAFWGASNMTVTATDVPDLSQVSTMALMFSAAYMANPDTSMWDTSNVSNMRVMFQNATSANPDVSNWDTSGVSLMDFMFAGATNANPNLSHWDFNSITDMTSMLSGSGISTINYDVFLVNIDRTTTLTNVNLNNVPAGYCSIYAQTAFTNLTTTKGWTINDLGQCSSADPANDFVIEVDTTIVGSTSDTEYEINTSGGGYNYNVDCDSDNAGTNVATGQTGNYICSYTNPGTYTISISDNVGDKTGFPRIYSSAHNDKKKIINLKQWGTGIWSSMFSAFIGAENMIVTAIDAPDLSQVNATNTMFRGAFVANPDTKYWDTSQIEHMVSMFSGAWLANPDTSGWDTSQVINMNDMFRGATAANPDTSGWDTSQVISMSNMFVNATAANPDTSGWDTSQLFAMDGMFRGATAANPDTSGWDTFQVRRMNSTFEGAIMANPDTSGWDTSQVRNMADMFHGATSANPDTSGWDTSLVDNMANMFNGATSANPDVSSWDITNINGSFFSNMSDMFLGVTLPTADYDAMLAHFNSQAVQQGLTFSGGNSKYCNATAHDNLTNATTGHGWTINDGGLDSNCSEIIFKNSFEDIIFLRAVNN